MKRLIFITAMSLFSSSCFHIEPAKADFKKLLVLNEENVYNACVANGLVNADIVTSQSILESGHYKSRLCREYNNIFGLYDSRKKDFYRFDHWIESVIAYKKKVQYKHRKGENYYSFLKRIGYAEDKNYIQKVRNINSRRKHEKI